MMKTVLAVPLCLLLVLMCAVTARALAEDTAMLKGEQLFTGQIELKGRLRGQPTTLPAKVVACQNCHALQGDTQRSTDQLGPALGQALTTERARHGGPAFAFGYSSFCTLLREGKTPTGILIAYAMPVFEMDNDSCYALWRYLIHKPD